MSGVGFLRLLSLSIYLTVGPAQGAEDVISCEETLTHFLPNRWTVSHITDGKNRLQFKQEEVLKSTIDDIIKALVEKLIIASGGGEKEVGCLVILRKDGSHWMSPFITSDKVKQIAADKVQEHLEMALEQNRSEDIRRVQFYHTHPNRRNWTISKPDVDTALVWSKWLRDRGLDVSIDIHAVYPNLWNPEKLDPRVYPGRHLPKPEDAFLLRVSVAPL